MFDQKKVLYDEINGGGLFFVMKNIFMVFFFFPEMAPVYIYWTRSLNEVVRRAAWNWNTRGPNFGRIAVPTFMKLLVCTHSGFKLESSAGR